MMTRWQHLKTFLLAGLIALAMPAAAAPTTLDQFNPPVSDPSVEFLREVFGPLVGMVAAGGSPSLVTGQDAFGAMMMVYATAVLFVGMLFMLYIVVRSTVDTAQDGEWMGKKTSAVYVPVRAAGGMTMLFPMASGYNLMQALVIWVTLQGVGIGDVGWQAFLDKVQATGMTTYPNIPDARPLVVNIFKRQVCAAKYNLDNAASGNPLRITLKETMLRMGQSNCGGRGGCQNNGPTANQLQWVNGKGENICGTLSWAESYESSEHNGTDAVYMNAKGHPQALRRDLLEAQTKAVRQVINDLRGPAVQAAKGESVDSAIFERLRAQYEAALLTAARSAITQSDQSGRDDFLGTAKRGGWIYAGTWYNHFARLSDSVQAALNSMPVSSSGKADMYLTPQQQESLATVMAYADEIGKNVHDDFKTLYNHETDMTEQSDSEEASDWIRRAISAPFMGAIHQMTEEIGGSNLNHMSQMKAFGDTLVVTGEVLMVGFSGSLGTLKSNLSEYTVGTVFNLGEAVGWLGTLVTFMVIGLMGFGITLSTYIPMLPYIIWLSAVANWLVLVVEAVIAAPLWAVAHIHPEGHDVAGKGGQGWMLVLSLLMRPVLMVFGLVAAMMLVNPVAGLINASFMTAVSGVQADNVTGVVKFLAYLVVYVLVSLNVIHLMFNAINFIPDNVLRWIGGHNSGGLRGAENVGDKLEHAIGAIVSRNTQAAKPQPKTGGDKPTTTPTPGGDQKTQDNITSETVASTQVGQAKDNSSK